MRKHLTRAILIALISLTVTTVLWKTSLLESFEATTWDARVRLLASEKKSSDKVILILLDQDSLDWVEENFGITWMWPRELYTYIINFVKRGGAKALAFDVLFTGASSSGVYDDQAFGSAIELSDFFVGSALLNNDGESSWADGLPDQNIEIDGLDGWLKTNSKHIARYSNMDFPIDEVSYTSKMLANVKSEPERDGIYRYGNLFYMFGDRVVPSLALATYLVGSNENNLSIKGNQLFIGDKNIKMDKSGKSILRYGSESSIEKKKAGAIIQSELRILEGGEPTIDPAIFKDAYVLFGFTAPGLLDLRPTPISKVAGGVEIHAAMLDNLLENNFISDIPFFISFSMVLLMAFIGAFLFSRFQGPFKGVMFFVIFIGFPLLLSVLLYKAGYWLPLVYMELSLILALAAAGVINYATEGRQKRYIKQAFKQYLSPHFIESLISSPDKLKLGGEKKEISIFFSDLEGFTTISEGLTPEVLTSLLNQYLTAMTDIILEEGGTIDKYEGDAIIAFWNAPIDYKDHALRAVRASLRCQEKLRELRPYFYDKTGFNLKMRIGLNTGYAVVGNLGSNTRFDYTMLGDSVNLAARLEGINKQFGTYTMISQTTFNKIDGAFPARELSKVAVVGKNKAITVYEPYLESQYNRLKGTFKSFNRGLKLFYSGDFPEAIKEFERIKERDPAALKYIDKCKDLINSNVKNWDGVWKMTQK